MNTLFAGDVYIRLADDNTGFVCTVKYGKFNSRATEFAFASVARTWCLERDGSSARKKTIVTSGGI